MGKVTYIVGAGASYMCLPIVTEIPKRLEVLRSLFEITKSTDPNILKNIPDDSIEYTKNKIINQLGRILTEVKNHVSVDTYAKKLLITQDLYAYIRLKILLSFSFIFDQTINPPDIRYDAFFASILKSSATDFEDINVISWNYDYQFEKAYHLYSREPTLSGNQNILNVVPGRNNPSDKKNIRFSIFKINGTTNFKINAETNLTNLLDQFNTSYTPDYMISRFIEYYFHSVIKNPPEYFPLLSFAWESSNLTNEAIAFTKNALENSAALVVIGYSFPFFNRSIDKKILSGLKGSKCQIYIQDTNCDRAKNNMLAVLPNAVKFKKTIKEVPVFFKMTEAVRNDFLARTFDPSPISMHVDNSEKENIEQFYLPAEL